MVSFYEEHTARHEAGYTVKEWYILTGYDRALEVALYRIRKSVDYQTYKAQEQRIKEEANKPKH